MVDQKNVYLMAAWFDSSGKRRVLLPSSSSATVSFYMLLLIETKLMSEVVTYLAKHHIHDTMMRSTIYHTVILLAISWVAGNRKTMLAMRAISRRILESH